MIDLNIEFNANDYRSPKIDKVAKVTRQKLEVDNKLRGKIVGVLNFDEFIVKEEPNES